MLGGTSIAASSGRLPSTTTAAAKPTTMTTSKRAKASAPRPGLASSPRASALLPVQAAARTSSIPSSSTTNGRIAGAQSSGVSRRRRSVSAAAAEASAATSASPGPALSSLELLPVIDQQGYIAPPIPEGSSAAVLAIYSENRTLQLVAFSADPRRSLTTLVGRRPDRAYHYRAAFFPSVDQEAMVALRESWF